MKKCINARILNKKAPHDLLQLEIEYPKKCPICSVAVEAISLCSIFSGDHSSLEPNLFSTFFCPFCEQCFLGYYRNNEYNKPSLCYFEPRYNVDEREFSTNIRMLSPDFCRIYNQAYAAEQCNLNDISGISYRKALEFLIKDYAIFLNPDDSEIIKNMMLSPCISTYIDNRRIRKLATASAWIGNDETHYVRKLEECNVNDLTAFINAIVSFIDSDISSLQAEKIIEETKNGKV